MKKGFVYLSLLFLLLSSFIVAAQAAKTPKQAIDEATEIIQVFFTGKNAPFFLAVVLTFLLFYSIIETGFKWASQRGSFLHGVFEGNRQAGISMALSGLFTLAVFYNTTAREYIGGLRIFIGYPALIFILAIGYFAYSRTRESGAHWSWSWGVGLLVIGISMIWIANSFPNVVTTSWIGYGALILILGAGIALLGYSAKFAVTGGGYSSGSGGARSAKLADKFEQFATTLDPDLQEPFRNLAAIMREEAKDIAAVMRYQEQMLELVSAVETGKVAGLTEKDHLKNVLSKIISNQKKSVSKLENELRNQEKFVTSAVNAKISWFAKKLGTGLNPAAIAQLSNATSNVRKKAAELHNALNAEMVSLDNTKAIAEAIDSVSGFDIVDHCKRQLEPALKKGIKDIEKLGELMGELDQELIAVAKM